GTWLVAVAGFGGMRDGAATLEFAPRLPSRLARLAFRLVYRGSRLRVDIHPEQTRYELIDGEALEFLHYGESVTVRPDSPQTRAMPPAPHRTAPPQPPGRWVPRRHREA